MFRGYTERFAFRDRSHPACRSYAYCDHGQKEIVYFIGWWLVAFWFIREHERGHVIMRDNGWKGEDCGSTCCIMSRYKGIKYWVATIKHRWNNKTWYCAYCRRRLNTTNPV